MAILGKTSITELNILNPLSIENGGTGATTADEALTNLGVKAYVKSLSASGTTITYTLGNGTSKTLSTVQGAQGNIGSQGVKGTSSSVKGKTGSQGVANTVKGLQGDTGTQGSPSSVQGANGPTGKQGVANTVMGHQGDTGTQGVANTVKGLQGDTGTQGSPNTVKGVNGPTGKQGVANTVMGLQGDTGSNGMKGISGVKGKPGATGTSITSYIYNNKTASTNIIVFGSTTGYNCFETNFIVYGTYNEISEIFLNIENEKGILLSFYSLSKITFRSDLPNSIIHSLDYWTCRGALTFYVHRIDHEGISHILVTPLTTNQSFGIDTSYPLH